MAEGGGAPWFAAQRHLLLLGLSGAAG